MEILECGNALLSLLHCQASPAAHLHTMWLFREQGPCFSPPTSLHSRTFAEQQHVTDDRLRSRQEEDNVRIRLFIQLLTTFDSSPKLGPPALKQYRTVSLRPPLPATNPVTYKQTRAWEYWRSRQVPAAIWGAFGFHFLVFCGFLFAAAQPFVFLSIRVLPHSTEKIHKIEFNTTNNCSCFLVDQAILSRGHPFDLLNFK